MTEERSCELYYFNHFGKELLKEVSSFIRLQNKISESEAELLIFLDVFPRYSIGQEEILESLAERFKGEVIYFSYLNSYHVPSKQELLSDTKELRLKVKAYKNVLTVAPKTILHWLFYQGMVENVGAPYFDKDGFFKKDASWVLKRNVLSPLDKIFAMVIGYAHPYPDAISEEQGRKLLEKIEFYPEKIEVPYYVRERVQRSVDLANSVHRIFVSENNKERPTVYPFCVDALEFGFYHTNTLVALLEKKYPRLRYLVIKNRTGFWSKKTGKMQFAVIRNHNVHHAWLEAHFSPEQYKVIYSKNGLSSKEYEIFYADFHHNEFYNSFNDDPILKKFFNK